MKTRTQHAGSSWLGLRVLMLWLRGRPAVHRCHLLLSQTATEVGAAHSGTSYLQVWAGWRDPVLFLGWQCSWVQCQAVFICQCRHCCVATGQAGCGQHYQQPTCQSHAWGHDLSDAMVCSGCCDGKHRGCVGHGNKKKMQRLLRGQIHSSFPAELQGGQLLPVAGRHFPADVLHTEGIHAGSAPNVNSNCSAGGAQYRKPVVLLVNGQWTRSTSNNMAHWLGEIMGPLLDAARNANSDAVLPLVPICPGRRSSRRFGHPAHNMACVAQRIRPAQQPYPHLGATPGGQEQATEFVSLLPDFLGMPWIADATAVELPREACLNVTIACPWRHCPTPKYLASIMPLYQRWLARKYQYSYTPPAPSARRRLLLMVRKPGGTRYIENHPALAAAAEQAGWIVDTVHVWRARKAYGNLSALLQSADVVASMHGADIALALILLRQGTVAIEVLLSHAFLEDPFYVFQGAGAGVHVLRWAIPPSAVPQWRNFSVPEGRVKDVNSWRRQRIEFTLPTAGWADALTAARLLLPQ
eukprot:TRINITY_DN10455_c0_g1_i1.p1 TRINITY_DN10455_c0_g1~~TRINITY_DN10455_c0_g1_i1.p1  ORF type:complete len:525 (+),score=70.76 TRINITY_DN10455_c0_g1_i1:138-1712(+)